MTLKIVGAGLGRTGTTSLKVALEQLLGGPCYHMDEAFAHPDHVPAWRAALRGDPSGLPNVMQGYVAAVDWPAGACWRELLGQNPAAVVLLSTRRTAEEWWKSADATILRKMRESARPDDPVAVRSGMIEEMMVLRFSPDWTEEAAAKRAYHDWNESVRLAVDTGRRVDWKPGDGWEPICEALGVKVPTAPFPHLNDQREFEAGYGWT